MNVIKFCFIVPFLFLIPTESLPVNQPHIRPPHALHIRKDFPGIISFGPIFISSVNRGLFTDHVSIHSCNGCSYGSDGNSLDLPLVDRREKLNVLEIFEVEKPLEVIPVQGDKPYEEDDEIDDLISDYNDYVNKSTLTSEQIYLIQAVELGRIREKELHKEFEVLNQIKEIPNKWEPEKEMNTPLKGPLYVHSNNYEHFEHSNPESNHPQKPKFGPKPEKNPYETLKYKPNSPEPGFGAGPQKNPYETQELQSVPYIPLKPVYETIESKKLVSGPFESTPEQVQKPESVDENLIESNTWGGPTSPEVAQFISEYIENRKPGQIYFCSPKDSTQISERHENLIKSSLMGVIKRIKNHFDGIRAYAARHDDTTDLI